MRLQRPHQFDVPIDSLEKAVGGAEDRGPWETWRAIDCNTFLAPMTHCSGAAFRRLLAANAAEDVRLGFYTQMVGADALLYSEAVRRDVVDSVLPGERVVLQLYGSDPWQFVQAARLLRGTPLAERILALDVNLGCPQRCAGERQYGLFVSRNWPLVYAIVRALREFGGFPVFAKIRVPDGGIPALRRFIAVLIEAGASAVCVHCRSGRAGSFKAQAQEADPDCLRRVLELDAEGEPAVPAEPEAAPRAGGFCERHLISKSRSSRSPVAPGPFLVPVVYNGGIRSRAAWKRQLEEGGCNAVMIGVGFLHHPALLGPPGQGGSGAAAHEGPAGQIRASGKYPRPTPERARELVLQYLSFVELARREHGIPGFGFKEVQRHVFLLAACWDRDLAQQISRTRSEEEVAALVRAQGG